jgi:hypothetical protein
MARDLLSPRCFGVYGCFRSGFWCTGRASLPGFLGVWLGLAGIAWVILSLVGILLPEYQDKVDKYLQPAIIGEIVFMLWLLIMGGKPPALEAAATATAGG